MNTQTNSVRYNIVAPRALDHDVRKYAKEGINQYVIKAVQKQVEEDKREAAWNALLALPPTFTEIADPVAWVGELRAADEERLARLGI